jgi:acyl-CoA thioester hydrolase
MIGNLPAIAAEGRHLYTLRVYYEDTDAGGVVYYANYLRFAERARTEALRALGVPHAELMEQFSLMFVVRRVEMDYLRPARLDDSLVVVTEVEKVGGATIRLRQTIALADGAAGDGTELTVARVQLACVSPGEERARRIPARWRAGLQTMMAARAENRGGVAGGSGG